MYTHVNGKHLFNVPRSIILYEERACYTVQLTMRLHNYCHVPLLYNSSQTVRFAHVTNLPLATMRNNILQTQS